MKHRKPHPPLMDQNGIITLRPANMNDLAQLYGMHRNTFRRWIKPFLKDIGKKIGHYYSISQVKLLTEKLGVPESGSHHIAP